MKFRYASLVNLANILGWRYMLLEVGEEVNVGMSRMCMNSISPYKWKACNEMSCM